MSVLQLKRQLKGESTEQKSLLITGTWSKLFPKQHNTETKSCTFVKKLMAVAISNITYLRSIFPEKAYSNRSLDGLPLKILKENSGCESATDLVNWLRGAFEALDKRYLRELMLIIYLNPEKTDIIHEMYTFRFGYSNGDKAQCKLLQGPEQKPIHTVTDDDLYKATQTMLRTIIVLIQGLGPLPETAYMTMKLTYFEDITPSDYEPKGFSPTEWTSIELPEGAVSVNSGEVSTNFHSMKLRVKAVPMNLEIRETQEFKENAAAIINNFSVSESDPEETKLKDKKQECLNNSKPNVQNMAVVSNETIVLANEDTIEENPDAPYNTDCVCKNNRQDILMLMCTNCHTFQHGACYKIVFESDIPKNHICAKCSLKNEKLICTDRKLARMASHEAASYTCIFRRALVCLLNVKVVSLFYLKKSLGVDDRYAEGILEKLIKDKVICRSSSEVGDYSVDNECLKTFSFPKYLGINYVQAECGEQQKKVVSNKEEILKEGNNMDVVIKIEVEDNDKDKEPAKYLDIENKECTNIFIETDTVLDNESIGIRSSKNNNAENNVILNTIVNNTSAGYETDKKRKLRRGSNLLNESESKPIAHKKTKYEREKTSVAKQEKLLI